MAQYQEKVELVSNGPNLKLVKRVDVSKPKVWREGHFYKFNSEIIRKEKV